MDNGQEAQRGATEQERERAAREGLYRPAMESDACGVGFVAQLRGGPTHAVVEQALTVLENLEHRGAAASDPLTGDGAGVLLQVPHALLVEECARLGFELGAEGTYGLGMLFLPPEPALAARVKALVERVVREEQQWVLGWREVPVDATHAGPAARASMPRVEQLFVGPGALAADEGALDRKLYVLRKRIESEVRAEGLRAGDLPYVASLSTRTVVYKGLLTPWQLPRFYKDLGDARTRSSLAVLHQRFSTNTFPSWSRAHPYRRVAHNGEINTLQGNVRWMRAREPALRAAVFGEEVRKLLPVVDESGSDSAIFDDVLELLVHTGRSLPHAVMMMIPEAWQKHAQMPADARAFYEYHACVMEPWDGPAAVVFSDGRYVGAVLDRNGLRPARYTVTQEGLVVLASETGVLELAPERVAQKGRLQPGRLFLVDTHEGRVLGDEEVRQKVVSRRPWARWLGEHRVRLSELDAPPGRAPLERLERARMLRCFGYTAEDLRRVLVPMARDGEEPVGSMGNDTPLAALSEKPRLLYDYFRQRFAQVTNPAIDPLREGLVMSLVQALGAEANLFEESPLHCRKLVLDSPVLTDRELSQLRTLDREGLRARTLDARYAAAGGEAALRSTLTRLGHDAERAVREGCTLLVLSDRGADAEQAPVPALLALGAVNRHLVDAGLRHTCGLVVETGEAREVMHLCLLVGYGAGAVVPYLAYDAVAALARDGELEASPEECLARYKKSLEKGLLKVLSKMGISTVQSYRGAQCFEALGLSADLVERYFEGTPRSLEGVGLGLFARERSEAHGAAFARRSLGVWTEELDAGGRYQLRRDGEKHAWNPGTLGLLQHAVRSADYGLFQRFTARADEHSRELGLLRGLLALVEAPEPLPLEQVEPEHSLVKRFRTGAMSFGSISREAHETLAVAMNRLGARSNTGEGGEDRARYTPEANGDSRRSAIKQVASGRFGVTIEYLAQAEELQIKISQGAKPGEGGQLPGKKVDAHIARTRHSTPGVTLVSPPPHHDIYSIEDLSQLIYDLKNANPRARVSVKLVAEAGVGTVAAGVVKARAEHVLIAGDSGGTGAAPLSSVHHAGVPWELGLAEAQQVLVLNGLRGRVRLETDGQLKTGRDVLVAALLGAEEFGFGTAALVSMGCAMVRACHLNTCPVGIATQDPRLRERFAGEPEHVVNYFTFLAREVREGLARLGLRSLEEAVGRVDKLRARDDLPTEKSRSLELSRLLYAPTVPGPRRFVRGPDHELELALDTVLLEQARPALERKEPVELRMPVRNVHRSVGTLLSHEVARRFGLEGLPEGTIRVHLTGTAGQSAGAFLARGIELVLEGDANDGLGKGLSGGTLVVYPPASATFAAEENVLVGNVALYGATSGECYLRGRAGERFAVRNSGALAVVEGCGDHGCEYMTGGRVLVLGSVGRNFAAGMSGGVAYLLDPDGVARSAVNGDTVSVEPLDAAGLRFVRATVHRHYQRTMSALAWRVLAGWKQWSRRFVRVVPEEYRAVLEAEERASAEQEARP